jgi:6-phosphogluconate dehydrogenase
MSNAEIGVIGLAVMGANLALNIADNGYKVAVFNRTYARTVEFMESAGDLVDQLVPCETLEQFIEAIRPPRPVIIMVKAGEPVDMQIELLKPLMTDDDIIIDAGNANFRDTLRREEEMKSTKLTFIGMGVSGGEEGARHGPSIMVGGKQTSYPRVQTVLEAISAKYKGEPCAAWLGENGAGHFVKTIHNGIEYADMQMIAEVYGIMRDRLDMAPVDISKVFAKWNEGPLESYLVQITADVLKAVDPKTDKPMIDLILDAAGQKGTGRWSAIEALQMGVPATAIEAAVAARSLSAAKDERIHAQKVLGLPSGGGATSSKDDIIADLELALLAGKIAAYAQGFAVMAAASKEFNWGLPMPTIAKIWRAGCIIQSRFLDEISTAFSKEPDVANLVITPSFAKMLGDCDAPLRRIVSDSVLNGNPIPALASAISYFDTYRRAQGTAGLIQGQRDFFGAHGFKRIDEEGDHHGPWS